MPARARATETTTEAPAWTPDPADLIALPDGRTMPRAEQGEAVVELRAPFPLDEIEKLPKVLSKDDRNRLQCREGTNASADGHYCGGYHARALHLDYVGHAGVTTRLGDVDPFWNWEPVATRPDGTPAPQDGGLWIRLTVLGVTRLGFGDADRVPGANGVKAMIGDALRNAALRHGVATYLWSKSEAALDLKRATDEHVTPDAVERPQARQQPEQAARPLPTAATAAAADQGSGIAVQVVQDAAKRALYQADPAAIRGLYQWAGKGQALPVEIAPDLLAEDERRDLGLGTGTPVQLGQLLLALGPWVAKAGTCFRWEELEQQRFAAEAAAADAAAEAPQTLDIEPPPEA